MGLFGRLRNDKMKTRKIEIELEEDIALMFDMLYPDKPHMKSVVLSQFILQQYIKEYETRLHGFRERLQFYDEIRDMAKEKEEVPEAPKPPEEEHENNN